MQRSPFHRGADDGNLPLAKKQCTALFFPLRLRAFGARLRGTLNRFPPENNFGLPFWAARNYGADDGNRTHTASLGSWSSTTKLHLRSWKDDYEYTTIRRESQFFFAAARK